MAITKPYFRIARIESGDEYIRDRRYAPDRFMLIQSYQLIENDLKKILEFIEPADSNKDTYSHRLYELLLRCSTEFETNCKRILYANGYRRGNLKMEDYYKINKATRVSEYEIEINNWYPSTKTFCPLQEWSSNYTLPWYQAYNHVKHDRFQNFNEATLNNVLFAAASVLAILFAQFYEYTFSPYNDETMLAQRDSDDFRYGNNSLFNIKPCTRWPGREQYIFAWSNIKNDPEPFDKYPF